MKKAACFIIALLFTACFYSATAQSGKTLMEQPEDSNTVNALNALSKSMISSDSFHAAFQSANRALAVSQKINYERGLADSYARLGEASAGLNDNAEARKYFNAAVKVHQQAGNQNALADCYFSIAMSYWHDDNYTEAFTSTTDALKLYEASNNKKGIALCNRSIAAFYSTQENYTEALAHYFASLKVAQETGDSIMTADDFTEIGLIYFSQGNYSKALAYDSAALKIYREKNVTIGVADILSNMAIIWERQGKLAADAGNINEANDKYASAHNIYLSNLQLFRQLNPDGYGVQDCLISLGRLNMKLNKFSSARDYLEKSLLITYSLGKKQRLRDAYNNLYVLDSLEGKNELALSDFRKYILYRDSVVNDKTARIAATYRMQSDLDKKEVIAKAEQAKKDLEAKQFRKNQYFIVASLAILILAVSIILLIQYRNNKQKQKANLLLQSQKEKIESTLTELKSAQAHLIQSEKMASLGQLTAGIAHEIQNPLNFVNNFSEVSNELIDEMKAELASDSYRNGNSQLVNEIADGIKQNLEKINHHGKRADAIVKGMLQHSRTSTGHKEPTDINALADEYLRLAYHNIRAKNKLFNATVKTDFDSSIGKINIIPQDIGKVMLNLYNNAFYAVGEKAGSYELRAVSYEANVTVSTKKLGDRIEIRVEDNGNGISQNIVDKIFQPFFTTKPTGQGTGLGLSLAYDIVKAHGGKIEVNSKEGEFTAFTIVLPVA